MFYYSVTARLISSQAKEKYLQWLQAGHVQALRQWAQRAEIIDLMSEDQQSFEVKSMYVFEDKNAFDRYVQEGAPQLRAEGQRIAQELGGIHFLRQSGHLYSVGPADF